MTFLGVKISNFAEKISDDFFLVIDHIFKIFPCFSQIFPIFAIDVLNVIFDPFLTRKTPFFTLLILSSASDNTTSLNIGGDQCMGYPPPQILGGQSPLGLRPCCHPSSAQGSLKTLLHHWIKATAISVSICPQQSWTTFTLLGTQLIVYCSIIFFQLSSHNAKCSVGCLGWAFRFACGLKKRQNNSTPWNYGTSFLYPWDMLRCLAFSSSQQHFMVSGTYICPRDTHNGPEVYKHLSNLTEVWSRDVL